MRQELPATTYIASNASNAPLNGVVSQANADTLQKLSDFLLAKFGYVTGPFQGYNQKTQSDKITAKLDFNINSKIP